MVIHVINSSANNWSNMREINDYNEDISSKTLLYDSSNPNDDMWRKFSLMPLTPPRSPSRTFGESSESNETTTTTTDIVSRLQDVCDSLDSAFDIRSCVVPDSKCLRSKLISDCMWSGNHGSETNEKSRIFSYSQTKLSTIEAEEDLYPTPCASPIPNVSTESTADYPSSNDCVDPTTVFPLHPSQESLSILSGQSDSGM